VAYEQAREEMTDDAAVAQAAGFTVTTIPGSLRAHKLTTQADVQLLQWMLESDSEQAS
jgi:2-C-methyl-D-erythritol 4-phosphate cytidylyltransferase